MLMSPKIQEQLGNWYEIMGDIVASKEWDALYTMLKSSVQNKKTVIPKSADVWKAWRLCDRHKVKCVIIGQDPYPTVKEDVYTANGIPFDCSNTKMLQPSLYSIWEAVEKYYSGNSIDPDMWQTHDISWWITEENILLINSSNTCEKDKPGSHWQYWEPIMRMFIDILNKYYRGLPIVLMGTQAQKLESSIEPMIHHIYKCEHPVMATRNNRPWVTDMFRWVNNILEANNGKSACIQWYRKKGEKKKVDDDLPPWVTETNHDLLKQYDDKRDMPWEKD